MLIPFDGCTPELGRDVYVAPNATVIGDVVIGSDSSIWFNAVIRGDMDRIRIGLQTNIQDMTVVHVDYRAPTTIGSRVTVGHRCIIHGCTIEDECLVGMGSILLNHVKLSSRSLVAAGSVLREGFVVPPGTLVAGVPAEVKRQLTEEELARFARIAADYAARARHYLTGQKT